MDSLFLEPLMREGRAMGLGLVIATQYPSDMSDEIAGATATRLYFSQAQPQPIRAIQRTVAGHTSGAEADRVAGEVRGLPPLTCLLANRQFDPYARVEVHPYYRRTDDRPSSLDSD